MMGCPSTRLLLTVIPCARVPTTAEAVRSDLKALSNRTATVGSRQPCARCGRALLDAPPNLGGLPSGGAIPQFYVFPTGEHSVCRAAVQPVLPSIIAGCCKQRYTLRAGLAFHVLCAAEEVVALGGPQRAKHTKKLLSSLARLAIAPPSDGTSSGAAGASGRDIVSTKKKGSGRGKDPEGGSSNAAAAEGAAAVIAGLAVQLEEEVGCEDPFNGELTVRLLDAPFIDPAADAAEIAAWQV